MSAKEPKDRTRQNERSELMAEIRGAYNDGIDEGRRQVEEERTKGLWQRFGDWRIKHEAWNHEWHMKNHKQDDKQKVVYICNDIGVYKFTLGVLGLVMITVALGIILFIARALIIGV